MLIMMVNHVPSSKWDSAAKEKIMILNGFHHQKNMMNLEVLFWIDE